MADVETFLARSGWLEARRLPLTGDASTRRYTRLSRGAETAILMEDPEAQLPRFLAVAAHLRTLGLAPPAILAAAPDTGLALLEDFGDALFAVLARQDSCLEHGLYTRAVDVLIRLAEGPPMPGLPVLDAEAGARLCETTLTEPAVAALKSSLLRHGGSPSVMSLRDFHAGNLIFRKDRSGLAQVGLLDFQDAVLAPAIYDLVSLLTDARRDVSGPVTEAASDQFLQYLGWNRDEFEAASAVWTVQRGVRIVGVFQSLAAAGKPGYLTHMPRVRAHVATALQHEACRDLRGPILTDLGAAR